MPDIKLRNQPFDLVFSPTGPQVYASLLTGEVKCWNYDAESGETSKAWTVRPTKRTARALAVEADGKGIWMGGKSGVICRLDASTGRVIQETENAHPCPVNRLCSINEQLLASGDDEGAVKFWDPRKPGEPVRVYTQHWDYISDFAYFEDKRQLVTTSGDGHLSSIDIRSSKAEPSALSADQDDELLSICAVKGGTKVVVGSGLGVLSIWSRKLGWNDSIDRIVGHPASIDSIVALTDDIVATGSEDGMVRVLQVQPNKFLGVIATHDEYPIERLAMDRNKRWLGSVSHDECIKLTDTQGMLEDDSDAEDVEMADSDDEDAGAGGEDAEMEDDDEKEEAEDSDSDSDSDVPMEQPKKVQKGQHIVGTQKRQESPGFFDDL